MLVGANNVLPFASPFDGVGPFRFQGVDQSRQLILVAFTRLDKLDHDGRTNKLVSHERNELQMLRNEGQPIDLGVGITRQIDQPVLANFSRCENAENILFINFVAGEVGRD